MVSDPEAIQHEDPFIDEPGQTVPWRRLVFYGGVAIILLFGSIVPVMIIGYRAVRLDGETKQWKDTARRRSMALRRQEALAESKRQEVNELDASVQKKRQKLDDLDAEVMRLKNDRKVYLAMASEGTEAVGSEAMTMTAMMAQFKSLLEAQKQIHKIRQDMAALEAANKGLQGHNKELRDKLGSTHQQMQASDGDTAAMAKLKADRQKMLQDIATNREIQKGMATKIAKLDQQKTRATRELDVSEKEARKFLIQAKADAEALDTVERPLKALQEEIAELSKSKKALGEEIALS